MMDVSDLVQAYSKDPINQYVMDDFDISEEQQNSVCGDMIRVYLKISEVRNETPEKKYVIEAFSHAGKPQMFTIAAASMLAEEIV